MDLARLGRDKRTGTREPSQYNRHLSMVSSTEIDAYFHISIKTIVGTFKKEKALAPYPNIVDTFKPPTTARLRPISSDSLPFI